MRRIFLRAGVLFAAAAVAVLAFAGTAAAHVTVSPSTATQGGNIKLTFRVPNEKDTASTVGLEINLPEDAPIASVSVKPTAGWTAVATKSTLATPIKNHDREITEAVTKIVWTATANTAIKPGEFQEFEIFAGPLPEVDQIVFKALQTYSDGDIVRWIDEPSGSTEPEHPAPVLKLAKGTGDHGDTAPAAAESESESEAHEDSEGGGPSLVLGIGGVVLGLAGLVFGLLAYRKAATRPS